MIFSETRNVSLSSRKSSLYIRDSQFTFKCGAYLIFIENSHRCSSTRFGNNIIEGPLEKRFIMRVGYGGER